MRRSLILCIVILCFAALTAVGQQQYKSVTDGYTPAAIAPGTPAGSYALSDIDTVSIWSGQLSVRIPLLAIGGRAEAGYTMTLPIKPFPWRVGTSYVETLGLVGWIFPDWWNTEKVGYSPGVVEGRIPYTKKTCLREGTMDTCPGGEVYDETLGRLTFIEADGTEHELVDTLTHGTVITNCGWYDCTCSNRSRLRGREFLSYDGSGLRFESDTPIDEQPLAEMAGDSPTFYVTGNLYFRDGRMYRVENSKVIFIRDRNGNRIAFTYDDQDRVISITDALGRLIRIQHGEGNNSCDVIKYTGAASTQADPALDSAARTIRVCYLPLGSRDEIEDDLETDPGVSTLREDFVGTDGTGRKSIGELFTNTDLGIMPSSFPQLVSNRVVSSVILPNGQQYTFQYNAYGEVARVRLPTGGAYEYDYLGGGYAGSNWIGSEVYYQVYRRIAQRRIYRQMGIRERTIMFPPDTGEEIHYDGSADPQNLEVATPVLVLKHVYSVGTPSIGASPFQYEPAPRELRTDTLAERGGVPKKSVLFHWDTQPDSPFTGQYPFGPPKYNERLVQTIATVDGLQSSQIFCYDNSNGFNNQTDVYEYDFGFVGQLATYCAGSSPSPPSGWVRRTHTEYKTDAAYTGGSVHLISLPTKEQVTDPSGTVAETRYEYDDYSSGGLIAYSNITGHDTVTFGASYTTRGNVTKVSTWIHATTADSQVNIPETWRDIKATYDIAGNMRSRTDGRNNTTQYSFDDSFAAGSGSPASGNTYAFLTGITNPLNQSTTMQYHYYAAKLASLTDPNSATTTYSYSDDALDRLKTIAYPIGSASYNYDDTPGSVSVEETRSLDSCGAGDSSVTTTLYDGLGREMRRSVKTDASHQIVTDRTYDAMGRLYSVSNPYQSAPASHWTTYEYDVLDRVTSVTAPDDSVTSTSYGSASSPERQQVTTTDPAQVSRTNRVDALGRLRRVLEAGGVYTDYTYDVLGNLISVNQHDSDGKTLERTFRYDSANRLSSASNPESGFTCYGTLNAGVCSPEYDASGNLLRKTDARGVITSYVYDELNRMISRTHSDSGETVTYEYDQDRKDAGEQRLNYAVGRLDRVVSNASTTAYSLYDAMGRVLMSRQDTGGVGYPFSYTYNHQGGLEEMVYPSSRKTRTCYDVAGRATELQNQTAVNLPPYASGVQYWPHGAIKQVTLGNGLVETAAYNERLQPTSLTLASRLTLGLFYCPNGASACTTNNGNVRRQTIGIPSVTQDFVQDYSYTDGMNRLTTAVEGDRSAGQNLLGWTEANGYDGFGNRWVMQVGLTPLTADVPQTKSAFLNASGQIDNRNHAVGMTYDGNGNAVGIGSHVLEYDAENRMRKLTINGVETTYSYDGEGRRVKRQVGSGAGALTTVYVYDAQGQLAAEYEPAAAASPCTTCYLTQDHLGSTRLVTDQAGAVVGRYDYTPFGVQVPPESNGRAQIAGYRADLVTNLMFTGKERDSETGLDYFGARYYSGAQGRFTSADAPFADQHPPDPQTWNLYSYVRNNPLLYVDPTGEGLTLSQATQSKHDKADYRKAINYIVRDSELQRARVALLGSNTAYTVEIIHNGNDRFDPNTNTIYWDPKSALAVEDNAGQLTGQTQTPALGLGHEIVHAAHQDQGTTAHGQDPQYGNAEERQTIAGPETHAAGTLKEGARTNHGGVPYESKRPTSRAPTKQGKRDLRQEEVKRGQNPQKYKTQGN